MKRMYWIPKENTYMEGLITIGKRYEVHYDNFTGEKYIYDDMFYNNNCFLVLDGYYVKV